MKAYSPMTFDFRYLQISFSRYGEQLILQGNDSTAKPKLITGIAA